MRTFYIKTLGCKVNQYEAQVIREGFLRQGYSEAADVDNADVCVVNSCTVTSVSDSKSLRAIHSAVRKGKCVVATGCMMEDKDLDLARIAGTRFIIKNKDNLLIMVVEIGEDVKQKILELMSIPGIEIEEIAKEVNLEYDQVIEILSEEYLKHNLDYGRRLCCRF